MRGADAYNEALFSTVRLEDFVPATHPLRPFRQWINEALAQMDARFSAMYEADMKGGCSSIAPEKSCARCCCRCCTACAASASSWSNCPAPAVPLVRRPCYRGYGVEPLGV
jgi:hypothetical protein